MSAAASADLMPLLGDQLRRVRASEYHRMIEASVFDEDEGLELIEGVIVRVSPRNADHALVVERLSDPLFVNLPPEFVIRCQLPLALSEADEPEPDVAVLERATRRSRKEQPSSALRAGPTLRLETDEARVRADVWRG